MVFVWCYTAFQCLVIRVEKIIVVFCDLYVLKIFLDTVEGKLLLLLFS